MLDNEEDIEQNREETQAELGWIAEKRLPIVWKQKQSLIALWESPTSSRLTVVVGVEHHLKHWKGSTGEIEENVADAPSHCAFSAIVHHSLWDVLDERDSQLDVAACVKEVKPVPDTKHSDTKRDDNHSEKDADDASCDVRDTLVAALSD